MEQHEIMEGNRLIALFMGSVRHVEGDVGESEEYEYYDGTGMTGGYLRNFCYHYSWDWLMPVIEKISKIPILESRTNQEVHFPTTFGMPSEEGKPMFRFYCATLFIADTLIEAAWLAVVDFIKWHNKTPTKL